MKHIYIKVQPHFMKQATSRNSHVYFNVGQPALPKVLMVFVVFIFGNYMSSRFRYRVVISDVICP